MGFENMPSGNPDVDHAASENLKKMLESEARSGNDPSLKSALWWQKASNLTYLNLGQKKSKLLKKWSYLI
jgi:hypothetical protein